MTLYERYTIKEKAMLSLEVKPRQFLPQDFKVTSWDAIKPFGDKLLERDISTREAFNQFLLDETEFSAVLGEEGTWRYIRNSTHTNDTEAQKSYEEFITLISPPLAELGNELNKKILASPFVNQPESEEQALMFKRMKLEASMFRSENIALQTEVEQLGTESGKLRGAMTVEIDGQTLTLQQAGDRLFSPDRTIREQAWTVMQKRRMQDKDAFDVIFDQMVKKRHQIALNAGYKNFRDYQHDAFGRFDYSPSDCYAFHEAVEKHVVPILSRLNKKRADLMKLDALKPWDGSGDPLGRPALKAFNGVDDMVNKGITMLDRVDPFFGDVVRAQRDLNRLDLESRPHKRPGGYNAEMRETHVPFMFANVTSKVDDVATFIHEAGHASHDVLTHDLPLQAYKSYPIEIAEVASMSMELFAFDKWDVFFSNDEDKKRAQHEFLLNIIYIFPWMAQIDAIQHAFYVNPDMTAEERHDAWFDIVKRFTPDCVDRTGFDEEYRTLWQKQTHVFTYPFYYIEYAIAQLGALQLWRNYLKDPKTTIAQYRAALTLGYTKSLPELYETAGIKFDFSPAMLQELVPFLMEQIEKFEA
jgi:oligoendopeptidase F